MKRFVRWLVPLVLLLLVGLAGWRLVNQAPERVAHESRRALSRESLPAEKNAPQPARPSLAPDTGGRFQTGIDPRFQGYASSRLMGALATADAAGDRETALAALATLERRAQLGDDAVPRLLLDSLGRFSADKRQALVRLLGRIATPAALAALFELTRPGAEPTLRRAALAEISRVGTHTYDNGEYPMELSPPLEQRLPQAANDSELLAAVAGGLASIGAASGVEALLETIESRPDEPQSHIIARQLAAVRNPAAVAPLATRLNGDAGSLAPVAETAGNALAAMGDPAATEALLDWAARAEDDRARALAQRWLGNIVDDASVDLVMAAEGRYTFRDPGLLAAIQARLWERDAETRPYVEGPGQ
ncbi:HEAT repeat domain-containing protein [Methylomagnum sp.]